MPTHVSVTFSGLILLRASRTVARIGLLKARTEHKKEHGKEHFPMIVVRSSQLAGGATNRPEPVDKLGAHVRDGWLPELEDDSWVGFKINNSVMEVASSTSFVSTSGLNIKPPSKSLKCPNNNWDDLGWLVNFSERYPGMQLKSGWIGSAAVSFEPPQGTVVGRKPVDLPKNGAYELWNFNERTQAYSDAFTWKTQVSAALTFEFHAGGRPKVLALEGGGLPIQAFVLNQPKELNGGGGSHHLKAFYDLPFSKRPDAEDVPARSGQCETAAARSSAHQDDHGDHRSVRSEEYCMAGGVWCEEEGCDNG